MEATQYLAFFIWIVKAISAVQGVKGQVKAQYLVINVSV